MARILVQVTINRRLLIGRDGHLDQSEAYDLGIRVTIKRGLTWSRDGYHSQEDDDHDEDLARWCVST